MEQSSYPPSVNPKANSIIYTKFCDTDQVDLTKNNGGFTATNANGHPKFKFTLNAPHILIADGNPLLTLQYHPPNDQWERCDVFDQNSRRLLFHVQKSTRSAFLAESNLRYNIEGEWGDLLIIYRKDGNSRRSIAAAEKHRNHIMNVSPNENYAFIVALLMVLEEIHGP